MKRRSFFKKLLVAPVVAAITTELLFAQPEEKIIDMQDLVLNTPDPFTGVIWDSNGLWCVVSSEDGDYVRYKSSDGVNWTPL